MLRLASTQGPRATSLTDGGAGGAGPGWAAPADETLPEQWEYRLIGSTLCVRSPGSAVGGCLFSDGTVVQFGCRPHLE